MRRFLLIGLLAGLSLPTLAARPTPPTPQPDAAKNTVRRHLIYFRDKTGTPFSVSRPEEFLSGRALQRRQRQQIAVLPRD